MVTIAAAFPRPLSKSLRMKLTIHEPIRRGRAPATGRGGGSEGTGTAVSLRGLDNSEGGGWVSCDGSGGEHLVAAFAGTGRGGGSLCSCVNLGAVNNDADAESST